MVCGCGVGNSGLGWLNVKDTWPLFGFSPLRSATLDNAVNNDLESTDEEIDKGFGVDVPLVKDDILWLLTDENLVCASSSGIMGVFS